MSYKFKSKEHRAIYVAGFAEGNAFNATIETLKGFKLPWTAKGKAAIDRVESICHDYVLSFVASRAGRTGSPEETAQWAESEFLKKAWKDSDTPINDKYRSEKVHKLFRSASQSLMRVCEYAGKPKSKAGNTTGNKGKGANKRDTESAARPASTAGNGHNTPNNPAVMLASNAPKDYSATYAIAALIADQAAKLETLATQNHVKLDDLGTVLREFVNRFKALPTAALIVEPTTAQQKLAASLAKENAANPTSKAAKQAASLAKAAQSAKA